MPCFPNTIMNFIYMYIHHFELARARGEVLKASCTYLHAVDDSDNGAEESWPSHTAAQGNHRQYHIVVWPGTIVVSVHHRYMRRCSLKSLYREQKSEQSMSQVLHIANTCTQCKMFM